MRISFFEEFPTKNNLSKFYGNGRIIIAAKSVNEFKTISKKIKNPVYWPILEESEGYWMSPFADYKAVKRVINDIKKHDLKEIMWDAELPMLKKSLLLRNIPSFFKTRKLILSFISQNPQILISKLPMTSFISRLWMRCMGVDFKLPHRGIMMCYQSFMPKQFRKSFLAKGINHTKKQARPFIIGLGVITTGILGTEQTISPAELKEAITTCQKANIDEVVIFRLGGLTPEYKKALSKKSVVSVYPRSY